MPELRFDVLSLFPEILEGVISSSMIARGVKNGTIDVGLHNIRDWATDKHKITDDRPFGGGAGMVLKPEPIFSAVDALKREESKVIYLAPDGEQLTSSLAKELSSEKHLILLSGHYEGVDQRVRDGLVDREVSIGDYVLTNGTLAAGVLIDCVSRMIPGFLGKEESLDQDSFNQGELGIPMYTRPVEFNGMTVPEVLLSGNHALIEEWRTNERRKKTESRRPDLIKNKGK